MSTTRGIFGSIAVPPVRSRRDMRAAPVHGRSPPDAHAMHHASALEPSACPTSRCTSPLTPAPVRGRRCVACRSSARICGLAPAVGARQRVHLVEQAPRTHVDFLPEKCGHVEWRSSRSARTSGQERSSDTSMHGSAASSAAREFIARNAGGHRTRIDQPLEQRARGSRFVRFACDACEVARCRHAYANGAELRASNPIGGGATQQFTASTA